MSWYRTGTLTLTNGSTAVTGSGTAFIANAAAGEALLAPDGKFYEIAAVVSDTSLTLGSNYLGSTASGQAYTILPSQSFVRDLAAQAAALIQTYADIATGAGAGKFDAGTASLPGIAGSADTDTGINMAGSNVLNLVAGGATRVAVTTAGAAVTGTLTTSGNATLGDSTSADSHTVNGIAAISANSASAALKITQAGSGNALTVEDVASDTTPFVITGDGDVVAGYGNPIGLAQLTNIQSHATGGRAGVTAVRWSADTTPPRLQVGKSRSATIGTYGIVQSGDQLGGLYFYGDDGTDLVSQAASIIGEVDGTPGLNDMPGRLIFSTTADGASIPTERMRIDSAGQVGIGGAAAAGQTIRINKNFTGATSSFGITIRSSVQSDVTSGATGYQTFISTQAAAFALPFLGHFQALQSTIGAGSTVTSQYGFYADSSLTGATNNYGFYSNIASGTGRWNFYAAGTAPNYFAGDVRTNTVVTKRTTTTTSDTTATATAASLITGIRIGTPTAAIELQVPTGTNMDAAFQDLQQYQSFEWSYMNMASATHTVTITANTDHTLDGNMIVQPNSSGRFLTRKSGVNTFSTYRIA